MVYSILISWLLARQREATKLNENSDVMLPWRKTWLRHKTKTVISPAERIENSHPLTPERSLQDL